MIAWTLPVQAAAQDLEPRAYAASPVGINSVVVIAGRSTGGVLVDPSLPIEDVEASVNTLGFGYARTFALFDRTALLVVALPIAWLDASGRVGDETGHASRTGLADPRIKLSVNVVGGRALSAEAFARAPRPTIVGFSITAAPPLGQYDRTRLVNIGGNRWGFKPEIGFSHLVGKWTFEGYAGAWLFMANDAFYTGESRRTQQPIVALQAHVGYTMKPRLWLAMDATWYSGGRTTVDGVRKADLQRNSRIGGTFAVPITRHQSLKVTGSTGATTRVGADFTTFVAAWQISWFD